MGETLEESNVSQIKEEKISYEEKLQHCNEIAKPMASKKLLKKLLKLVKKAAPHKGYLRCGLKEVQTRIRKGETGIAVFAGDIHPIDIMCHLPAVCEEKDIPYVYVPSRKDLGASMGVKRGCLMVLIRPLEEYQDTFDELKKEISLLSVSLY